MCSVDTEFHTVHCSVSLSVSSVWSSVDLARGRVCGGRGGPLSLSVCLSFITHQSLSQYTENDTESVDTRILYLSSSLGSRKAKGRGEVSWLRTRGVASKYLFLYPQVNVRGDMKGHTGRAEPTLEAKRLRLETRKFQAGVIGSNRTKISTQRTISSRP